MRNALSAAGIRVLRKRWTLSPVLAFDFDGTLAPIVSEPTAAAMPDSTRALLYRLAEQHPCIVVSGRARADVMSRLGDIPVAEVIGNHGSEPWLDTSVLEQFVADALPILREQLSQFRGIEIEDKRVSISVHYRKVFDRKAVMTASYQLGKTLGFAHIIPGKLVINLLPDGALDKAQGLLRAMSQMKKVSAIFVGDDMTDERVFELPDERNVLGVRVGYRRKSQASLYLPWQRDINALLSLLLRLKSGSPQ